MPSRRLHLGWLAVVVPALVACCLEAEPAAGVDDSLWGQAISAVDFVADEPVDERSLRELLPVRVREPLLPGNLEAATHLLESKDVWSAIEGDAQHDGAGVRVVFHLVIKRTVDAVSVSGYETFYAEDLVRRIRIPSGAALNARAVDEAAERLREYYRREGFPDVVVTVLEQNQPHRQTDLDFHIDEGRPVTISCVVLEGDLVFAAGDLADALGAGAGDRRKRGTEREVKRTALEFYRDRNYFDASVTVTWRTEADPKRGALILEVDPGPKYALRFVGNEALSRSTLLDVVDVTKRPVVTEGTWREMGRRIAAAYRAHGYPRVEVKVAIEEEADGRVVEYRIDEGGRYLIRAIDFVGNATVPAGDLLAVMRMRPEGWVPFRGDGILDQEALNDDLRRIWFLYRKLGFQSAEILDAREGYDEGDDSIVLTIEIGEGPRSIVTDVSFADLDPAVTVPLLSTRVGEPFNPSDADADAKALVGVVNRLGYPEARVAVDVEGVRTGATVDTQVRFDVDPGAQRTIGPVVVQNNLITKDRVVLRELPFEEGDPYDPQLLIDGQTNVYRLGLFRRVTVRPLDEGGESSAPPVAVQVDERPAGTFSYGFGYESDIGFRVFGEAAYDNLQGMDRRLSLRGDVSVLPSDPSESQYLANLGFRTPRVLDSRWVSRSNAILVRNTQTLNRFSFEGFTLATALEREIWPRFVVGGVAELDQADTFDVNPDANLAPEGVKDEGFLRQVDFGPFVELDRRDDPFAPRTGTLDTAEMRYAPTALGSDIRFLSMIGRHSQYIPLPADLTFVYAMRGALALPLDGEFSVPIRDRYFVGGRTSVRGFEENSIAPLGEDGSPIGGDIMLNGNLELRFPLFLGLGGAVFLDGGGAFLRERCTAQVCNFSSLSWNNFRESAGLGLRYLTPVGPISLEYGFKLDRREDESLGAFHFTIGNIF